MAVGMADDLEPEIVEYKIRPEDWLVLHTDGMPKSVCQRLLTIKQDGFHKETVRGITSLLNQIPYDDNVTISIMIF